MLFLVGVLALTVILNGDDLIRKRTLDGDIDRIFLIERIGIVETDESAVAESVVINAAPQRDGQIGGIKAGVAAGSVALFIAGRDNRIDDRLGILLFGVGISISFLFWSVTDVRYKRNGCGIHHSR